jgi:hypothetical protein
MTRLSCHHFRSNEVRLWLSVIAYNLGNLWGRLVLPKGIDNWLRTSLQERPVKTGGRLVKHARYYWPLLAESHLTRRLFGSMVGRIEAYRGRLAAFGLCAAKFNKEAREEREVSMGTFCGRETCSSRTSDGCGKVP